ncbi:hypothetical protein LUTEI9C_20002 [Luteimonas sp. 9C]|nr:hypothetical protein LUTEI9C_20002 [Luteimonas sp. 9C]
MKRLVAGSIHAASQEFDPQHPPNVLEPYPQPPEGSPELLGRRVFPELPRALDPALHRRTQHSSGRTGTR